MDCEFRDKFGPMLRDFKAADPSLVPAGFAAAVPFSELADGIEAVAMEVALEAHILGRIYAQGGEKAKPAEVEARLHRFVLLVLGLEPLAGG